MSEVSMFRLYALRAMYVFMFVGLALVNGRPYSTLRPACRIRVAWLGAFSAQSRSWRCWESVIQ